MLRVPYLCLFQSLLPSVTRAFIDERNFLLPNIITRDVAIIGGGASGTYAGVRLHEDLNVSMVIIEETDRIGGHVETLNITRDGAAAQNDTIEFGVQSYIPYGPARGLFQRFGINTMPSVSRQLTTIHADIETGGPLAEYSPPSANDSIKAFETWLQFVEKYEPFMEPGYWNFPHPGAIPPDFLLSFSEFAKKYRIEAAVPVIAEISGVGTGGLQHLLTLSVIQVFGAPVTRSLLEQDLFVPHGSNSLLYQRAYDLLKEHVYLESSIKEVERNVDGVRIIIDTKKGAFLIKAKQVLWTPAPSHKNLGNFDLDDKEAHVFKEWVPYWSFVGILSIPCIPENHSIVYLPPTIMPSNYLAIRDYPYALRIDSTGPPGLGLFRTVFSTNYSVAIHEAKKIITQNIQKTVAAGTLGCKSPCNVEYKAFVSHDGVLWPQSREDIENGLVQKMNALQGYRSTYYTGRSFGGAYSSNVWATTDTVIGRMVDGLKGYCSADFWGKPTWDSEAGSAISQLSARWGKSS